MISLEFKPSDALLYDLLLDASKRQTWADNVEQTDEFEMEFCKDGTYYKASIYTIEMGLQMFIDEWIDTRDYKTLVANKAVNCLMDNTWLDTVLAYSDMFLQYGIFGHYEYR